MSDPRIKAIRDDVLVGRDTCSSIDECFSSDDLKEQMDEEDIGSPESAVRWARANELRWLEEGARRFPRLGLKAYNEFKEKMDTTPINIEWMRI